MPIYRNRGLLELSIQANIAGLSPAVREQLGAADAASVNAALVPLQAEVDNLATVVADTSGSMNGFETLVSDVSGALYTDMINLDAQIAEIQADWIQVTGETSNPGGSPDTYFSVNISGASFIIGAWSV